MVSFETGSRSIGTRRARHLPRVGPRESLCYVSSPPGDQWRPRTRKITQAPDPARLHVAAWSLPGHIQRSRSGRMKVLIVCINYLPEANSTTLKISDLAHHLRDSGHEVTVVKGFPNYPEGVLFKGYWRSLLQRENIEGGVDQRT